MNPEPVVDENITPAQSDTNTDQKNVDANLAQNQIEGASQSLDDGISAEHPDFRKFREARKLDREKRRLAEEAAAEKERELAALKAAMEAAFGAKQVPSPQAYQQYYGMDQAPYGQPEETEDERMERKVNELLAKKEAQQRQEQEERERREYPQRLIRDMPDFNQVCSQENLDYLDFHYPEISSLCQDYPEGYEKWKKTYAAVKKLIPNHANAKKEAMRADINSNKPRSMSTVGQTPTGERATETLRDIEARRAQRYAEMKREMKRV